MNAARRLAAVPEPTPAPLVADGWDLVDYPQNYLDCRRYGHNLPGPEDRRKGTRVVNRRRELIEVRYGLMCKRCKLTITEVVDARTGEQRRELPAYPDGYLRKGLGRLSRWQVRLEEIRRLTAELGRNFDTVIAEED